MRNALPDGAELKFCYGWEDGAVADLRHNQRVIPPGMANRKKSTATISIHS